MTFREKIDKSSRLIAVCALVFVLGMLLLKEINRRSLGRFHEEVAQRAAAEVLRNEDFYPGLVETHESTFPGRGMDVLKSSVMGFFSNHVGKKPDKVKVDFFGRIERVDYKTEEGVIEGLYYRKENGSWRVASPGSGFMPN